MPRMHCETLLEIEKLRFRSLPLLIENTKYRPRFLLVLHGSFAIKFSITAIAVIENFIAKSGPKTKYKPASARENSVYYYESIKRVVKIPQYVVNRSCFFRQFKGTKLLNVRTPFTFVPRAVLCFYLLFTTY